MKNLFLIALLFNGLLCCDSGTAEETNSNSKNRRVRFDAKRHYDRVVAESDDEGQLFIDLSVSKNEIKKSKEKKSFDQDQKHIILGVLARKFSKEDLQKLQTIKNFMPLHFVKDIKELNHKMDGIKDYTSDNSTTGIVYVLVDEKVILVAFFLRGTKQEISSGEIIKHLSTK